VNKAVEEDEMDRTCSMNGIFQTCASNLIRRKKERKKARERERERKEK
jgi:hypothetical protein